MTTPYTPEERERAEQQVLDADERDLYRNHLDHTTTLQMRLNRFERREAEARELLKNHPSLLGSSSREVLSAWTGKVTAWLSEEGV